MMLTPIDVDTPQDRLAKAIATELAIEGVDECGALPVAITIMAAVQRAIDADDLEAAIMYLREDRRQSDNWWIRNHPRSKHARLAKVRRAIWQAREAESTEDSKDEDQS